ncbi:lysozyme-like protein [Basidiobolus meristosporus CBS 931.73]|uniref:Lysozyme-like protein n=1 Tax=Basidiobolus meristosporus CBS 931.73 TaxID=1314790 RepID=A0A1Y1Y3S2_9FUNG|nr:lysozyme-like protein [Basidiobolus meristosporus CBS 931.73]|eukprot:ORX92535.1 lysozyme-like protein [Basidiobolus meristosporus CBS 931.73]
MMTNVFEYGTTTFGYATCDKLGDGRGYTCGLVGFTTGTNDALAVVAEYNKIKPNSELAKFIPELTRISKLDWSSSGRDDTSKLGGFTDAWKKVSCSDPDFRAVQDKVADQMYLIPGLQLGEAAGISTNLGKAIILCRSD